MSIMTGRPLSISLQTESDWLPPLSSSSTAFPSRTGHYQSFSALNSPSPYIEITVKSPLRLRRTASASGLQQLCHNMGIQLGRKEQSRAISPATLLPTLNESPSRRVKKKKSITPILVPSYASGFASINATLSKRTQSEPRDVTKVEKEVVPSPKHVPCEETGSFMPKNIWAKRHNMKLHPYHKQVPYMQAYDPISLQSDRYAGLLLQRLSKGLPSFHDYGNTPPATVLDLGCGPGHWILHATKIWRNTKFTAFDLVDVTLPGFRTTENVEFIQGDFINFRLPFPDNTFDLVRMANLVLCIPYDKWEFVLGQVHRVLTPGGRLELIDDQFYFPYGEAPKDPFSPILQTHFDDDLATQVGESQMDNHDDDETLKDEDSADTDSTLLNEQGSSGNVTLSSSPESFESIKDVLPAKSRGRQLVTPHSVLRRVSSFLLSTTDGSSMSNRPAKVDMMPTPTPTHGLSHFRSHSNLPGVPSSPKAVGSGTFSPSIEFRRVLRDKVVPRSLQPKPSSFTAWDQMTSDSRVGDMSPMSSSHPSRTTIERKGAVWQRKVCAARNLEKLFEKMLTEEYEIHPQPAEFLGGLLRKVFSEEGLTDERRVRKLKSFHIKLAPLDAEFPEERTRGKGGSNSTKDTGPAIGDLWSAQEMEMESLPSTPLSWEEKKQDQHKGQLKSPTVETSAITTTEMTLSLIDSQLKSQFQNTVSSVPPVRTVSAKAAVRLGISYSELSEVVKSESRMSLRARRKASNFRFGSTPHSSILSVKPADLLGISCSELSDATAFSAPRTPPPPPKSPRLPVPFPSTAPFPLASRSDSPWTPSIISSTGPVQHTGLLIWPSTYIPMSAGELEMHACKYIHTLLGCRPALEEFVAKFVDEGGVKLVGEEEFKEEIWEYECFRRARFNWPLEVADPFEDNPSNPHPTSYGYFSQTVISPPNTPTTSPIPFPTNGNLELPTIRLTHSIPATGSLHVNPSPNPPEKLHVADVFEGNKVKVLRPTKSNIVLRSSSPLGGFPHHRYEAMKAKVKPRSKPATPRSTSDWNSSITDSENRSGSVTPTPLPSRSSTPTPSSKGSSTEKLAEVVTTRFAKYRRQEPVHLRTIRVFEAIKAA